MGLGSVCDHKSSAIGLYLHASILPKISCVPKTSNLCCKQLAVLWAQTHISCTRFLMRCIFLPGDRGCSWQWYHSTSLGNAEPFPPVLQVLHWGNWGPVWCSSTGSCSVGATLLSALPLLPPVLTETSLQQGVRFLPASAWEAAEPPSAEQGQDGNLLCHSLPLHH